MNKLPAIACLILLGYSNSNYCLYYSSGADDAVSSFLLLPGCHGFVLTRSSSTAVTTTGGHVRVVQRRTNQRISSRLLSREDQQGPDSSSTTTTSSSIPVEPTNSKTDSSTITLTVTYEGQSCDIQVQTPEESILAALERQSRHVRQHLPGLPDLPSDCRRGNCLTCAAKLQTLSPPPQQQQQQQQQQQYFSDSNSNTIVLRQEDGLSQAISDLVASKGYVLTCSSYLQTVDDSSNEVVDDNHNDNDTLQPPQRPNLQLLLGQHDPLWHEVYASPGRFTTDDAQLAARSAMAKVIRQYDERHRKEWMQATQRALLRRDDEKDSTTTTTSNNSE